MDESENGTAPAICLYISLFFFSVFRLLPILNDEYTLPPPAGKESYCHSRMRSSYVLGCSKAVYFSATHGQDAGELVDGSVGVGCRRVLW